MDPATEEVKETKQDQAVQPGDEEVKETEAGEVDGVDTATTKESDEMEKEDDEFSLENIGSDAEVKKDGDFVKEDGVSEKAQERINKKIGGAIKDRNIAQDGLTKANAKIAEMQTELANKSAPTERPLAPLREDFDLGQDYQTAMSKYQDDTIAFNAAANNVKTQTARDTERVKANDGRLIVQMDELQKRYPDDNIRETIAAVANAQGYGNAAAFINDSEHSARIALFLAKNESERIRIGSLTDAGIINREIGKLEERFIKARKKTTNAPKSLDTIDNKTETTEKKSIYEIKDNDEFLKARNKEIRQQGQRK